MFVCVCLSLSCAHKMFPIYTSSTEKKTIIKDLLVSNKIQHVFCLSNSLFLYSAYNRRSVSFLLGIKTRKKLLLHWWSKDSENRGATRLGTPGTTITNSKEHLHLLLFLACFLSFFLSFFLACFLFVLCLSLLSPSSRLLYRLCKNCLLTCCRY